MPDASAQETSAFSIWRAALSKLADSRIALLKTHLVFVLLGIAILAPLVGITGQLLLKLSGEPAAADQDIAWFLLSPVGLIALVIFAGMLVGILAFEQVAMLRLVVGRQSQKPVEVVEALHFTALRSLSVLVFATHLSLRVLCIVLPFLAAAAALAWWLISDYDINYYLSERPPEFIKAAALIAMVLLAMAVLLLRKLLGWTMALPILLFENVAPRHSFKESKRRMHGERPMILGSLIYWALSALTLAVLAIGIVRLVGAIVVPPFAHDLSSLLIALGMLAVLLGGINVAVTTFSSGHFAAIIASHYLRLLRRDERHVQLPHTSGKSLRLITPIRVIVGLLAAVLFAILVSGQLIGRVQIDDSATIVAHRGAAGRAPENTLASIRAAIEDETDWVEIDVQETANGTVVVVHDSDFMKLAGNSTKVWEVTDEQLLNIDIGSWFGAAFAEERVPTLLQVLETARGHAKVVIELKYYGHDQRLEERVAEIVEAAGMVNDVAIMSLKYDAVRKMKSIRPSWMVGLLSATAIGDLSRLDADFLAVSSSMASAGFVRRAHAEGKKVFVWTVNDPVTMSRVLSVGVDGVITDEPAMARDVLADRAQLSSAERLLLLAATFFGRDFVQREYRDDSP
jgi:glycerophosphoryl diester phosphodiesterase